ncbi:MAG: hypothetical protein DRR19_23880 [Candidatus Parabeggiatoa sp. nov. 1]|nr:MAG: hypothetical protein DRR19_23880 [Gammaproteobacteria bacterium]
MKIKLLTFMVISSLVLFSCAEMTTIKNKLVSWIDSQLDKKDDKKAMNVLDTHDDGKVASWKNPDTQSQIELKPVATYQNNEGQHCRQFELIVNGNSQKKQACRNKETERWKLTDV